MKDERTFKEIADQVKGLINNNPCSLEEIANDVNISRGEALEVCDHLKAKQAGIHFCVGKIPPSFEIDISMKSEAARARVVEENKRLKKINETLTADLVKLQKFDNFELILKESCYPEITPPHQYVPSEEEETTAVLCLSDWHIGERVEAETVGGINEYDSEIAQDRAMRMFNTAKQRLSILKNSENLTDLVVWLGGDFISGYIHPELEESNTMSPPEESILMISLVKEGLRILSELNLPITVVTSFGNHGRTTFKKRQSTGAANNFEYLVYNALKAFELPVDTWVTTKSKFSYLHLYGKVIRFHHGDDVKASSRNGFCGSVLKKLDQLNQQKEADLDIFGHFHTLHFHPKFVCNGSLIGPSPFSVNLGFAPEPPQQGLILLSNQQAFVKSSHALTPQ